VFTYFDARMIGMIDCLFNILLSFKVFALQDKEQMKKESEFWALMFLVIGATNCFSLFFSVSTFPSFLQY